jgi:hypothetical protein
MTVAGQMIIATIDASALSERRPRPIGMRRTPSEKRARDNAEETHDTSCPFS